MFQSMSQSMSKRILAEMPSLLWRPSFAWHALTTKVGELLRICFCALTIWRNRSRQRRELREYLASDYRAARDIGITQYDAQHYINRPFWRS